MNAKPRYRMKASGAIIPVSDGFTNAISALGEANEKVRSNGYAMGAGADQNILRLAYYISTWYQKILEIPADDATREWRGWKGTTTQITKMEDTEKQFKLISKMRDAIIASRHYGGAALYMGGLPGISANKLNLDLVQKDSLKFVHVFDKNTLQAGPIVRNPESEYYGQPEYFLVNGENGLQKRIHTSRLVIINGKAPPGDAIMAGEFWARPIWERLSDSILNADGGAAIISSMMHESTVDVVKVKNFVAGLVAPDAESIHMKRWSMTKRMKSVGNLLLLDGEDEWEQKRMDWNGLPQVQNTLLVIMSGAADIPVTRVLGTSATGTNATGEGDLKNHYDNVRAMQKLQYGPALNILDEVLYRHTFGSRPKDMWYEWNSLWQPSDKEMAETERLQANAAAIISNRNLVPHQALADVVQTRMIESGRWPGLESALKKHGTAVEPPGNGGVAGGGTVDPNSHQTNGNASGTENERGVRGQSINVVDARPRSLCIQRKVLNGGDIHAWAKAQGLETALPKDDLHVTVIYSREEVDWMKIGESYSPRLEVAAGGPRLVETFGKNATVLLFACNELEWRHRWALECGAKSNYEYQPHITITYKEDIDPSTIEPYKGEIVLGPELFAEVNEDWSDDITEVTL